MRLQLIQWRNRLLMSPAFQEWVSSFPLTRGLAQKKARAAFDLAAGFVYSQVLRACAETGLLQQVRDDPATITAIADSIGLPIDGATRLVAAAASLKLLEPVGDDRYALGETGAAFLGNPSVFAMIRHNGLFYQDLVDPVALLRKRTDQTALAAFWKYAGAADPASAGADDVADYSVLMAETQGFIAKDVLDAVPLGHVGALMDVAGGEGAFLTAALTRYPQMKGVLCDLPPVAARAAARFAEAGLAGRASTKGCNAFRDALPRGADAATLVRVLHDHDDDAIRVLLAAIYDALPENGEIIIAEPMADIPGAEPVGAAYFGLYLWAMGSGRPRSPQEICAFLGEAGFSRCTIRRTRRPMLCNLVTARKNKSSI